MHYIFDWAQQPKMQLYFPHHLKYKVPEKLFFIPRLWSNMNFFYVAPCSNGRSKNRLCWGEVDRYTDPSRKHWLQVPRGESQHYHKSFSFLPAAWEALGQLKSCREQLIIKNRGAADNRRLLLWIAASHIAFNHNHSDPLMWTQVIHRCQKLSTLRQSGQ